MDRPESLVPAGQDDRGGDAVAVAEEVDSGEACYREGAGGPKGGGGTEWECRSQLK